MSEYFVVYAIIWICSFVGLRRKLGQEAVIFSIQIGSLFALSVCKFETGFDWPAYKLHYEGIGDLSFGPAYSLIENISIAVGLSFEVFWAVLAGCIVVFAGFLISRFSGRNRTLVVAIFYSIAELFLIPVFSTVRQSLATLMILLAFYSWTQKRLIYAVVLAFVALLFHITIAPFVIIPFIFIYLRRVHRIHWGLFIIFATLYVLNIPILRQLVEWLVMNVYPPYALYLERDTYGASLIYRLLYVTMTTTILYLISLNYRSVGEGANGSSFARAAALSGLILSLALYSFPTFSSRYLLFTSFFIVPSAIESVRHNYPKYFRILWYGSCFVFLLILYRFLSSPFSVPFVPYQSSFEYDALSSTGLSRTQDLLELIFSYW